MDNITQQTKEILAGAYGRKAVSVRRGLAGHVHATVTIARPENCTCDRQLEGAECTNCIDHRSAVNAKIWEMVQVVDYGRTYPLPGEARGELKFSSAVQYST